jgi:hypothetical protein
MTVTVALSVEPAGPGGALFLEQAQSSARRGRVSFFIETLLTKKHEK